MAVGIPAYTVLGALGLWTGSAAWDALATSVVADPTLLAGPKAATAVVSVLIAVFGIALVDLAFSARLARATTAAAPQVGAFAAVGGGIALVPGALITLGSGHPWLGAVLVVLALVIPAALTGVITATALPSVSRSRRLALGFDIAAIASEIAVLLWAAFAFTPLGG
jgi:hypothetical protein